MIELFAHLVEVDHLTAAAEPHRTLLRRQIADEEAKQGGLSRAVGAYYPHPVTAHDGDRKVPDHLPAVVREGYPICLDDQVAGTPGFLQLHPGLADPFPSCPALLPQLLQRPDASLVPGPARLDPLPQPGLLPCQLLVEQGQAGHLRRQEFFPPRHEGFVATGKCIENPPVQLGDPVRNPAREGPIVGNEEEGLHLL